MKAGTFPEPIALGMNTVAWPSDRIDAWIAEQIERDAAKREAAHA